jgi:hypothetical protein
MENSEDEHLFESSPCSNDKSDSRVHDSSYLPEPIKCFRQIKTVGAHMSISPVVCSFRAEVNPRERPPRAWRASFFVFTIIFLCPLLSFAGATYYLAPAGLGGNDGHNGSSTSPWLTPNHSLNCGDVIIAAASTSSAPYSASNFNAGNWGTVTCSDGTNGESAKVAWLECATFDACKISSSGNGIYIDQSYWGVQGFEVTVGTGGSFCFGAGPNSNNPQPVHHVIFANNVANGCQEGGFVAFASGTVSVDHLIIVGNIAYNASYGPTHCYSGISVFEPQIAPGKNYSGTHIYIAGNFSYGNYDPNTCNGTTPTDGEGVILDTFDGSENGLPAYTAQSVVTNNILVANGGRGLEVQNNAAGSANGLIIGSYNTLWYNNRDPYTTNLFCADSLILTAKSTHEYYNIVKTNFITACHNNAVYAYWVYQGDDSTDWVYDNLIDGMNGQNKDSNPAFSYDSNNTVGEDPEFVNPQVPAAPVCSGKGNVPNCMSGVISNFALKSGSPASGYGRQPVTFTPPGEDQPPHWVCNVGLPSGLITPVCAS